jgi:hypothetical protein
MVVFAASSMKERGRGRFHPPTAELTPPRHRCLWCGHSQVTKPTQANVTLNMGSNSAVGGYAKGILGCYRVLLCYYAPRNV